jgi:hypothetical protein
MFEPFELYLLAENPPLIVKPDTVGLEHRVTSMISEPRLVGRQCLGWSQEDLF